MKTGLRSDPLDINHCMLKNVMLALMQVSAPIRLCLRSGMTGEICHVTKHHSY